MKKFLMYSLKWQSGIIVSYPCMYLFHDYLHWNNFNTIIAFQFVGACVFYNIDVWIFSKQSNENLESK